MILLNGSSQAAWSALPWKAGIVTGFQQNFSDNDLWRICAGGSDDLSQVFRTHVHVPIAAQPKNSIRSTTFFGFWSCRIEISKQRAVILRSRLPISWETVCWEECPVVQLSEIGFHKWGFCDPFQLPGLFWGISRFGLRVLAGSARRFSLPMSHAFLKTPG